MSGLAFYAFCALGFALYLPARSASGFRLAGLNFVAGYGLMVLSLAFCAVALRLDNRTAVALVALAAMGGFALWIWRWRRHGQCPLAGFNPVFLLLLVGAGAIALNGGIGYTPTTNDEFTNWIGVSRLIHFAQAFDAIKADLNHPGYLPGWRLLLLAPWQVSGEIAMGLSAPAPFVLHVAVLSLLFDLVAFWTGKYWQVDGRLRPLVGLGVVLVFAAAEGLGRLWPLYLLIEPPQIMTYAALVLTILAIEAAGDDADRLWRRLGIVLAASAVLKVPALIWLPGIAVAALITTGTADRAWIAGARRAAWACGPALAVFVFWKFTQSVPNDCVSSAKALLIDGMLSIANDWTGSGFLGRFGAAVGGYFASYKAPLSIAAALGILLALWTRRGLAAIAAFALFALGYFMFMYFANLVCWIDGGEELTSYQRYSRVAVQTFHALGLALLVQAALEFLSRDDRLPALFRRKSFFAVGAAVATVLVAWQAWQTFGTVADLEARKRWPADARIADMRQAVEFVLARAGRTLPQRPRLVIVDQGRDYTAAKYAAYFATAPGANGPEVRIDIPQEVSWSPTRNDEAHVKADRAQVAKLLAGADVIWIRRSDPWIASILAELGAPAGCATALVRDRGGEAMRCEAKDSRP